MDVSRLDEKAPQWLTALDVPSVAVAYVRDGSVQWTRVYGEPSPPMEARSDRIARGVAQARGWYQTCSTPQVAPTPRYRPETYMPEEPTPREPDTSESRAIVEEENALHQVARELASARDIPAVLQRIAELSRRAAGADASYLERIHLARQEVEVVATAGESAPVVGVCVPYPGSLAQEVVERDRPEVVGPEEMRKRAIGGALSPGCLECTALVVPLISEREALGALILLRSPSRAGFAQDEVSRLRVFADMAALALRDVLSREAADRRLRELQASELRFRLLVEGVRDYGIFMLDPAGHVVSWNEGARRIKGYTAEEILGKHFSLFYPPEAREARHPEAELEIAAREGHHDEEGWRLRKGGSAFWASVAITAIRDADGELVGFSKVTHDLTERKQAEEEARLERRRLRAVLDVLPVAVFIADADATVLEANAAAEEVWGRRITTPIAPEDYGAYRAWRPDTEEAIGAADWGLLRAVRTGEATRGEELEIEAADGTRRRILYYAIPIRDPSGQIMGAVAVNVDVTDRHRLLAEADAARGEAERANRAKSEFLATMSHEIRTPINAIIGYTELLEMGLSGPVTPTQRTQLERVRTSSAHLLGLINDVLDLAKVEAGRMKLEREPASIEDAVRAAISLLGPQAAERGIALRSPRTATEHTAYLGDEDRVRQILVNLLSNAVKFTEPGGAITVRCGTTAEGPPGAHLDGGGPWVFASVEDTGIGIPSGELDSVFLPFVQADSGHTRARGGTGLGLTISRELARLMGGDLTATSEPGGGSEFTLWLPATTAVVAPSDGHALPASGALGAVGEAMLAASEEIMKSFVERLRHDPELPTAAELPDTVLRDHGISLLSDIAQTIIARAESDDELAETLRDSSEIQRVIAELHGAQRARIGWTEEDVHREFQILREEVEEAVARRASDSGEDLEVALGMVIRSLASAERTSCRVLRHAGR